MQDKRRKRAMEGTIKKKEREKEEHLLCVLRAGLFFFFGLFLHLFRFFSI
jgi:hypothetical protein